MKKRKDKSFKIFATDLRRWCFCPKQWWYRRILGRKIKVTEAMKQGLLYHSREGEKIDTIIAEQKKLTIYLIIGGVLCLLLLLSYLASLPS